MPRPIEALIHVPAIAHNLARARHLAPDSKVWAVVKANAYGHGIANTFEAVRSADGIALLDFAEAKLLRELGWRGPILLLEGCFEPRDLELCSRLKLWHTVHCEQQIDWLAMHKTHEPHRVFLKLNSGMNRLGFGPQAFRAAWTRLNALPQVDEISLMTHFSDADAQRLGQCGIAEQLSVFEKVAADLPGERSLSNSAATLRHNSRVRSDWVRAGIMTYGGVPDFPEHDQAFWDLRPAMTLRSKIIAVQHLQPGDTVGYGSSFTAERPMRIGVVACGYADGYPRHCPSGTPVLVDGKRSGTVGRVSMDMLAVDLSGLPQTGFGSEVTLWGQGPKGALLSIDEVALAGKTIGYELMCALAPRVPVTVQHAD
ncbi:alanine racemase [Paucibacter oligotrophus]|uniref:Alanine racemase n=1 Tax=Roseateles oligotrophus TaxID=1769250 RepID=A0A840LDF2_9BURK|nr:alanine racemase [Roseateles oligotrophus]MBB4843357.1 alanine racemase [Roseateles oligotrophus]